MPILHTHRPHHLALAIALAFGGIEMSHAQQTEPAVTEAKPHPVKAKKITKPKSKILVPPAMEPVTADRNRSQAIPVNDPLLVDTTLDDNEPAAPEGLIAALTPELPAEVAKNAPDAVQQGVDGPTVQELFSAFAAASTTHHTHIETTDGFAEKISDGNDLVILTTGARQEGIIDGGGGLNGLKLNAVEGGTLGETRNFRGLLVEQGVWNLTGFNDFSHGVGVLNASTLYNQGSIAGDVMVETGGLYGGAGSVNSLFVDGGLSVSSALGAARVRQDLYLNEGAIVFYGIDTEGRSATVVVEGTATIGGATLAINAANADHPLTSKHAVLQAGNVVGTFAAVTNNLAYMTPTLTYTDTSVDLTYARNDVPLKSAATTDNARQVANSLESEKPAEAPAPSAPAIASTTQTPKTVANNTAVNALLTTSMSTAGAALEQLAGGSNANLANATLSSVRPVSASMLSAMRQLSNDASQQDRSTPQLATGHGTHGRVWVQALGNTSTVNGHQSSSVLKQHTHGLVVGADWSLDSEWRVGVLGGKSQTRLDGTQLDGDLDNWYLGAYALRQSGPLALRFGATYGSHDGTTKRNIAFNRFSDTPKGSYDASSQQAFAELGYNLGSGRLSAEPFVNLGYERYQRDSYQEKGGAAALKVDKQIQDNLNSTFGLRLAHLSPLDNGMSLTPRMSAGWKHTYGDISRSTRQALVSGGKAFNVQGSALDRDNVLLEAGLDLAVSTQHTLSVAYNGEVGSNNRDNGVMGQWRMSF
ncbi:autotransporter domain-containing protein [Pseudomonas purpurea]|uniref:autotransporter outer membrane beta-barrel domain-containing protein n=1 Tax=Pseudomonas purpurea TaxID=3136737 RepID=UPI003266F057